MKLSIAICTWNRADLLAQTLRSFEAVRVPDGIDWELLVINNACTDRTDEVIASFQSSLPIRRLFERRPGQSVARNLALREFKGDTLVFTDDDVIPESDWIVELLKAFEQFGADVAFGRSRPVWTGQQPRWFGPPFAGQFALLDYGPEPFTVTDSTHQFYGVNVAFTRRAVEALGDYREDIGLVQAGRGGGEDTDMFERCRALQLKIVYQPTAIVGHVIPPERMTRRRQRQLAWRGGVGNYRLTAAGYTGPSILGTPRYLYRIAVDDMALWVRAAVRGDRCESFFRQIRVVRFAALVKEGIRHRGQRATELQGVTPKA